MAGRPRKKDPVEAKTPEQVEQEKQADENKVDISRLNFSDLKEAVIADAQSRHPFSGYPEQRAVITEIIEDKEYEREMNVTHLVIFDGELKQDPSNKNVTLGYPALLDNQGREVRKSTQKTGSYETTHSEWISDYENGGEQVEVVFDRKIKLDTGGGQYRISHYGIAKSPSVRAQLIFEYNSKSGVIDVKRPRKGSRVIGRYFLADPKQMARLRRVYEMIINPKIRLEEAISSAFDSGGDFTTSKALPGIPEGD